MIEVSILTDPELITKAVTSPNNLPWAFQEGDDPSKFKPCFINNTFLGAWVDGRYAGWSLVKHLNEDWAEVHFAYLPPAYGHVRAIATKALDWIKNNTGFKQLCSSVVVNNTLVNRLAQDMRFEFHHVDREAFKGMDCNVWTYNIVR